MSSDRRQVIILIAGIVLILILAILTNVLESVQNTTSFDEEEQEETNTVQEAYIDESVVIPTELSEITQVFLKNNVSVVGKTDYTFSVIFPRDLFDEKGNSEEEFFDNLVEQLMPIILHDFELIDSQKNVRVKVLYNEDSDQYQIIFNDNEDFYEEVSGDTYIGVETAEMVEPQGMFQKSALITVLEMNDYYFHYVEKYLTEKKELDNGYVYYPNEGVKFFIQPNESVLNVVFDDTFEGEIIKGITVNTPLLTTAENYEDNFAGSVNDGFLAYRNAKMYVFFYPGEVSYYTYSTTTSKKFDKLIDEYIKSGDLDAFAKGASKILAYTEYEYDADAQRLKASFPTRGIQIDIRNNDPKGITLYNNYLFNDTTKQYIKDGKISFIDQDSVYLYEKERVKD